MSKLTRNQLNGIDPIKCVGVINYMVYCRNYKVPKTDVNLRVFDINITDQDGEKRIAQYVEPLKDRGEFKKGMRVAFDFHWYRTHPHIKNICHEQ